MLREVEARLLERYTAESTRTVLEQVKAAKARDVPDRHPAAPQADPPQAAVVDGRAQSVPQATVAPKRNAKGIPSAAPSVYTRRPNHLKHLHSAEPPGINTHGASKQWSERSAGNFILEGLQQVSMLGGAKRPRTSPSPGAGGTDPTSKAKKSRLEVQPGSSGGATAQSRGRSINEGCTIVLDDDGDDDDSDDFEAEPATAVSPVREEATPSSEAVDTGQPPLALPLTSLHAQEARAAGQPCRGQEREQGSVQPPGEAHKHFEAPAAESSLQRSPQSPRSGSASMPAPEARLSAGLEGGGGKPAPLSDEVHLSSSQAEGMAAISTFQPKPSMKRNKVCFADIDEIKEIAPLAGAGRFSPPPPAQADRVDDAEAKGDDSPHSVSPEPMDEHPHALPPSKMSRAPAPSQPDVDTDTQYHIWPLGRVPAEVAAALRRDPTESNSTTLATRSKGMMLRLLGATFSWMLGPMRPSDPIGKRNKPWWRWLGKPGLLHRDLPLLRGNAVSFFSPEHHGAYLATMVLEEVRASASARLQSCALWRSDSEAGLCQRLALEQPRRIGGQGASACRIESLQGTDTEGCGSIAVVQCMRYEQREVRRLDCGAGSFPDRGVWRVAPKVGAPQRCDISHHDMVALVRWGPEVRGPRRTLEYLVGVVDFSLEKQVKGQRARGSGGPPKATDRLFLRISAGAHAFLSAASSERRSGPVVDPLPQQFGSVRAGSLSSLQQGTSWLILPLASLTTALRELEGIRCMPDSCGAHMLFSPVPMRCCAVEGEAATARAGWWQACLRHKAMLRSMGDRAAQEALLQPNIARQHVHRPAGMPELLFRTLQHSFNTSQLSCICAILRGGALFREEFVTKKASLPVGSAKHTRIVPGLAFMGTAAAAPAPSVESEWASKGSASSPELYAGGAEVTLVQGPPGTGKTFTIRGIVSALLATPPAPVPLAKPVPPSTRKQPPPMAMPAPRAKPAALDGAEEVPSPFLDGPGMKGAPGKPLRTSVYAAAHSQAAEDAPKQVQVAQQVPRFNRGQGKSVGAVSTPASAPRNLGKPASCTAADTQPSVRHCQPMKHLKRILVCAPSNAALDELVARIVGVKLDGGGAVQLSATPEQGGLWDAHGKAFRPQLVRIGKLDTVHPRLHAWTLDAQVRARSGLGPAPAAPTAKRGAPDAVAQQREAIRAQEKVIGQSEVYVRAAIHEEQTSKGTPRHMKCHREAAAAKAALQREQRSLALAKDRLRVALALQRQKQSASRAKPPQDAPDADGDPGRVLADAAIVACTLAGASSRQLAGLGSRGFDAVVIDEACQAVEASTLVPLMHRVRRLVLVGDPMQLPPTILSQQGAKVHYDRSFFERCVQASLPVHMLTEQYRMHPAISAFPSQQFYGGRLRDSPVVLSRARTGGMPKGLAPLTFVDVSPRHLDRGSGISSFTTSEAGGSSSNALEAELVAALHAALFASEAPASGTRRSHGAATTGADVGIISPYKDQVKLIQSSCQRLGCSKPQLISTVDSFQGREQEFIIISCVRSGIGARGGGIGFLRDFRRMCVSITRARRGLVLVGDARYLAQEDPHWKALVDHCSRHSAMITALPPTRQRPVPQLRVESHPPSSVPEWFPAVEECLKASQSWCKPLQSFARQPASGGHRMQRGGLTVTSSHTGAEGRRHTSQRAAAHEGMEHGNSRTDGSARSGPQHNHRKQARWGGSRSTKHTRQGR